MAGNPRVLGLLEQMLDSGQTPEEVCRDCPELLSEVRRLWKEFCAIDEQVGALLPGLRTASDVSAASHVPTADQLEVPGYELAGEVGRGGMGVVYRARDLALDRDVAVKLLQDRYPADSSVALRFTDEARITAQLQHPGVPAVYRVGTLTDGRPFLAMKLIKGHTLSALLGERPDPAADRGRFAAIFEHVCQAIAYAHSLRVIHRDLKPSNVMVGKFGEVQLMDWGLAKVLPEHGPPEASHAREKPPAEAGTVIRTRRVGTSDTPDGFGGQTPQTRAGSVLGTPAYMSPEQAGGEVDRLDGRCDVFGLGAVLCEVLTGKPPYTGRDEDQIYRKAMAANQTDARARLAACGAEPELVSLCLKCLAPEPDDRPRDAGEVAAAVAALRAAAEDRARRAELDRVRTAERSKRRRVQAALAAAVALLACGVAGVAWWQDQHASARRAQLIRNEDALEALVARCDQALRDGDADSAAIALDEVDRRLAEGGGGAVRDRAGALRADLTVLREMNRIDTSRWAWVTNKLPAPGLIAPRWRAALAGYGIVPGTTPAAEAAARVSASPVRIRLLTALDQWLLIEPSAGQLEILQAADPDPYRIEVRSAIAATDTGRLTELAGRPEALAQPPHFAAILGQLSAVSTGRRRVALVSALRPRPGDLTLLMTLGNSYPIDRPEGADERVRWYQAAVSAHPRFAAAHNNLGAALRGRGDVAGAVACYREAIRLDPEDPSAHYNLGNGLADQNDPAGAVVSYREAIRLDPKFVLAHYNLGMTLSDVNDPAGAEACNREVIRLDPTYARGHNNLGILLVRKRDLKGAEACFREAVRLDPTFARAHANLANVLLDQGDYDGAVKWYREVVRLAPGDLVSHKRLAALLARGGEFRAAIEVLKQGMATNKSWATDPATGVRYESVCYACRAAAGAGKDPPPESERPALRNQALGWLTADLAVWRDRLAAAPVVNRAAVHEAMSRWLADPALGTVRRRAEVEALPKDEWVNWVKLWTEVRDLHEATIPLEMAPPPRQK